jgi:hypothetical protein
MNVGNKEIMLTRNKRVMLPLIIFSNLFPLYGVLMYNWTIFSVVYIYWIELLIITFFQFLKIIVAQGEPRWSFSVNLFIGIKFLLLRAGLFFFYLLFIVVFLGFLASAKDDSGKSAMNMFDVVFFKGSFYRITLLSFTLYILVEFIVLYIINNDYKTSKPTDHNNFLDMHILVVHLVVVLGTFLYQGVTDTLHWNHKSAMIACVSLFVVIKIIADVVRQSLSGDVVKDEPGSFI